MCRVLNAGNTGKSNTDRQVYVGRPSKWGNPSSSGATDHGRRSSRNIATGLSSSLI